MHNTNRIREHTRIKRGLTGLETAIILIAFVIVASAFAFTVLNIGFQTTQKSQEVISGGLAQASATMEVDGSVIAMGNATRLHNVTFYVKPTPGNTDVDLNQDKLVITWTSKNKYSQNIYDGTKATVTSVFSADTDKILKFGDKYKIYINLKSAGVNDELQANNDFKVELKPQTGSVLTVARRLPPATEAVMFLG